MKNILGLCYRAKKLVIGYDNIENKINKINLILLSDLASDNLKKQIKNKSEYYNVEYIIINHDILNNALGKENIKTVGIIDKGFTKLILQKRM